MKISRDVDLNDHPLLPVLLFAMDRLGGTLFFTDADLNGLEARKPVLTLSFDEGSRPEDGVEVSLSFGVEASE